MDYFIGALRQYADFTGRTGRKEYWMYILMYFVFSLILGLLDDLLGINILTYTLSFALLVPTLSIGARRLHDTGRSGWWQLIAWLPIVGVIILIVFWAQDSHEDNDYGASPKV